jgi:murein DD-endopeptidase MepM/ murein hydrolase activator NlpD
MVHPTAKKGIVTSNFGWRASGWHPGTDIGGLPVGTPVYSSYAGIITQVVNNCPAQGFYCSTCGGGGGNWVQVTSGNIKTSYMHLNSVYVRKGQSVAAGQPIGTLGGSGCSTAPHLHFELVINNQAVDPLPYLKNASVSQKTSFLPYLFIMASLYILYENE